MEITRHFTVSVYIVHNKKVLLHLHKKLGMWLPVGGHIDRDELPQEAACREALEEAGLEIEFIKHDNKKFDTKLVEVRVLTAPHYTHLQTINPFHQHIDSIFFAKAKTNTIRPMKGESQMINWFSLEEVKKLKAPQSVLFLVKEVLEIID